MIAPCHPGLYARDPSARKAGTWGTIDALPQRSPVSDARTSGPMDSGDEPRNDNFRRNRHHLGGAR